MSTLWEDKKGRFIHTGPFDAEMPHHYIIISDYRWWAEHETEVYEWMRECLPNGTKHHQGMVVIIENEAAASNFLLRWNA